MPTAKKTAPRPADAGSKAPAFDLESDEGKRVTLHDFAGKWLVLYFYPKDNTPGCTREAQGFTAAAAQLKKFGAAVVGVSKDSVKSHCGFREKIGIARAWRSVKVDGHVDAVLATLREHRA
jgi:peroxiredoxin